MTSLRDLTGGADLTLPHSPLGTEDVCWCGLPDDAEIHTCDYLPDQDAPTTFPTFTTSTRETFRRLFAALWAAKIPLEHVEVQVKGGMLAISSAGMDVYADPSDDARRIEGRNQYSPDGQKLREALAPLGRRSKATSELHYGDVVVVGHGATREVDSASYLTRGGARSSLMLVMYTDGGRDEYGYGYVGEPDERWTLA